MRHLAFVALVFVSAPCECFQNEPPGPSRFPRRSLVRTISRSKDNDALIANLHRRMDRDRALGDREGTAVPSSAAPKPSVTSPTPPKPSVTSPAIPKPSVTPPTQNYGKTATSSPPTPSPNGNATPLGGTHRQPTKIVTKRPVSGQSRIARARAIAVSKINRRPAQTTLSNKTDGPESKKTTFSNNSDSPGSKVAKPPMSATQKPTMTAPSNQVDGIESNAATPPNKTKSSESKATTPSNKIDNLELKATSPSNQDDGTESKTTTLSNKTDSLESKATSPFNKIDNPQPKAATPSNQDDGTKSKATTSSNNVVDPGPKATTSSNNNYSPESTVATPPISIDGLRRKYIMYPYLSGFQKSTVTTPSKNSDGPGPIVTMPSIYLDDLRRKYSMIADLTGIQKSTVTPSLYNSDGPGPKVTTPSIYGDGLNFKGTGFTNFDGNLMVTPATPPIMAFYRAQVPTIPVNTPVSVFRPALTFRNLDLFNNSDVGRDGQTSGVTTTPDSLGNTIPTTDKPTASQPFTDSLNRFLRTMRSNAYMDDYTKTDDVAETAPRQVITDPNGETYKGRATKPTLTGFRSATV